MALSTRSEHAKLSSAAGGLVLDKPKYVDIKVQPRSELEKSFASVALRLPITGLLFVLLCATAANAKMAIDFNYKTFAYIGGVESLVRLQLNPELLNNRMHRAVVRELTAKGLSEVQPEEDPD